VIGTNIWNWRTSGRFKLRATEASFSHVEKAVGAEVEAAGAFESILHESGTGRKRRSLGRGYEREGKRKYSECANFQSG
jgi:hypothetical protein